MVRFSGKEQPHVVGAGRARPRSIGWGPTTFAGLSVAGTRHRNDYAGLAGRTRTRRYQHQ
ncbi:unnamed protein product [Ectocarpus sp. CCAP 1310/34]|nr:unnamed protein product [Ectocarpus sp. CCAP 1310/34]